MLYFLKRIRDFFRNLWCVWTQKESPAASFGGLKLLKLKSDNDLKRFTDLLIKKLNSLVVWSNILNQASYKEALNTVLKNDINDQEQSLSLSFLKIDFKKDYSKDQLGLELKQLMEKIIGSADQLKGLTFLKAALLLFVPDFANGGAEKIDQIHQLKKSHLVISAKKTIADFPSNLGKSMTAALKKIIAPPPLSKEALEHLENASKALSPGGSIGGSRSDDDASLFVMRR